MGYEPTTYTTSEAEGRVELNIVVFSPLGGAPRPFTLSVTTEDNLAGVCITMHVFGSQKDIILEVHCYVLNIIIMNMLSLS